MDSKAILAELCAQAPSSIIRDCLRKYSFKHKYPDLIKFFNTQRIGSLIETLAYLKPPHLRPNLADYTKEGIVKNLISRIESLFPDTCLICKKEYCTKIDDPHILPCQNCGQESHMECLMEILENPTEITQDAVMKLFNPYNLPGWSFNCLHCKEKLVPSPDAYVKKSVLHAEAKSNPVDLLHTQEVHPAVPIVDEVPPQSSISLSPAETDTPALPGIPLIVITGEPTSVNSSTPTNNENVINAPTQVETNSETINNDSPSQLLDIRSTAHPPSHPSSFPNLCKEYLRASCTKGRTCESSHPEICTNLLDHGLKPPYGCDGKTCHDLHPPLCKSSIRQNRCFNTNCMYYHIKGTQRNKNPRKATQNSGNDTTKSSTNNSVTQKSSPIDVSKAISSADTPNHFLDAVRLLKCEMLEAMDIRFATLKSEMTMQPQIQPPLNQPTTTEQESSMHQTQLQTQQTYPQSAPQGATQQAPHHPYQQQYQRTPIIPPHPIYQMTWPTQMSPLPMNQMQIPFFMQQQQQYPLAQFQPLIPQLMPNQQMQPVQM